MIPTFYTKYANKLQDVLPKLLQSIPEITRVIHNIQLLGGNAYLVGGTARDLICDNYLQRDLELPVDIDIEVFGLTQAELEILLDLQLTGNNFPVYNTQYKNENGKVYDIQYALPRTERKNGKGHNSFEISVEPNLSLADAVQRRDLTINAIYINLSTYEIIDLVDGINHLLDTKIADCVNPETFIEDPLRVLRTARMIAKFGLAASDRLTNICDVMASEYIFLTPELREKELTKIMKGENVRKALEFLIDVHWYERIFWGNNCYAICYYFYDLDKFDFDRLSINQRNQGVNKELVSWSVLCHYMNNEQIEDFFKNINPNWDKTTIRLVKQIVHYTKILLKEIEYINDDYVTRYLLYNASHVMGEIAVLLGELVDNYYLDKIDNVLKYHINTEIIPLITGDDILVYAKEGKTVGLALEFFRNNHINGIVTDRVQALKMLPNVVSLINRGISI